LRPGMAMSNHGCRRHYPGGPYPEQNTGANQTDNVGAAASLKGSHMPSEFNTTRSVEFSDTDMAGIVHFSRFFVFMEAAEHAFLRSLGTSVAGTWEGRRVGWPRVGASCDYLNPARFEDVLDVRLKVIRKGTRSMTYGFEFQRGDVLIATGRLSTVFCECAPGQPFRAIPIPDFIADRILECPEEEGEDDAEG